MGVIDYLYGFICLILIYMSNSTTTLINKYFLSKKRIIDLGPPPVISVEYTNVTYPDDFPGVSTYFLGLQLDDCYVPYTVSTSGDYKDGDYELYVSSYNVRLGGTDAHNYNLFVGNALGNNDSWCAIGRPDGNFLDKGVYRTEYTQIAYYHTYYRGGGPAETFYTTIYNGGSVDGEWQDMKFPFKVKLTEVNMKAWQSYFTRALNEMTILGSNDDGTTWELIQAVSYTGYATDTWNIKTITTNNKYNYIRFVFQSPSGHYFLSIGEMQLKFNAYTETPIVQGQEYTYTNITFPNDYTNLQSDFGALTQQDTIINFQPETQNEWWKDLTSYKIETSSYGIWNGTLLELPQYLFDGSSTTHWSPCEFHATSGNTFNKDGVNQGQYTQSAYDNLGAYRGGGSGFLYSFVTEDGDTISGEYVDITFPTYYKAILNNLSIMGRDNSSIRGPATVGIIGSNNNGNTWYTIVDSLSFSSAYTNGIYQTITVPAIATKFNKFRIVFQSTKGDVNLNIADIKFNYNAYITWG